MKTMLPTLQNRKQFWLPILAVAAILFSFINARTPEYQVKEVEIKEAKSLIDSGALVVDVRGAEAYHAHHIPGALSLPLAVLRSGIPQTLMQSKAKPVVVYCGDGVRSGPEGTHLLNEAGYTQAVNIKAGMEGWERAGLPVEKK